MKASLKLRRVGAVRVPLPGYHSEQAAGLDLCAALDQAITLAPGERRLVPTGLCVELPPGFEGQVRPRSGLALHHGITVLNAPGTIDSDFRGEICVLLIHHGQAPFVVEPLLRIAQLVIAPVVAVTVEEVEHLSSTGRGEGGYGSTGEL